MQPRNSEIRYCIANNADINSRCQRQWSRSYIVHDCRPSFHRDALEHSEHGEAEVIEVGDAAVRSDPVDVTDPAALRRTFVALAARPWHLHRYHVYTIITSRRHFHHHHHLLLLLLLVATRCSLLLLRHRAVSLNPTSYVTKKSVHVINLNPISLTAKRPFYILTTINSAGTYAGPASRVKAAVSKAAWWPWPFDLENGVRVMCDVGYLCANFGLPMPLCSRCTRQTSDRRQTKASLNASAH